MKTCTKCKEVKLLSDFRKDLNTKSLLSSWCKECHRVASKNSRAKNPTKEYDRNWKQNNPDKIKKAQKNHRTKYPKEYKRRTAIRKLKYLYNLSEMQYLQLLHTQGYACKICRTPSDKLKKKLNVDHCHETNIIRGLLCSNCNRGIGLLKDSVSVLAAAITYLEESKYKEP